MKNHDVVILGGGLSGLTLALQLKLASRDISVLVLEKRLEDAPKATHKVGESTVELGAYYLREVLQLKDYLTDHQLPKFGFRFFFSPEHRDDIARRVEVGSRISHPIPTHQIDRGVLENDLMNILDTHGVDIVRGAVVKEVILSKDGHKVHFETADGNHCLDARWTVDATGRRSLLKRTLGLEKPSDHNVNAAWFRLGAEIDIDYWSENQTWRNYLEPGRRRLATNHLMGKGYWVWLIPLVSGATSIGIVADPAYHPFEQFNSYEKAMQWLEMHEPLAANMLGRHKEQVLDFKLMKHYAHDTMQFYSADRWGVTGDAGAFLDPFYSPGTDFIALSNSWLTELITRDIAGEDIALRTMIYEHTHRELLNGWILLYQNMYGVFGNTRVMMMKIVWDWGAYWAVPTLIFANGGYTDLVFLKKYASTSNGIGQRFAKLNEQMQTLFRAWNRYENTPCSDEHINVFDLNCLYQFHRELEIVERLGAEDLIGKVESNLKTLEHLAAEIFRRASAQIHGTPAEMNVDPYAMSLDDSREVLIEKSERPGALDSNESIRADITRVWLNPVPSTCETYV